MFHREFLTILSVAAAIFLAVAGAGWFAVHTLQTNSRQLVLDTLPGLVNAGLAEERIHDNRHTMREMLSEHTAAERAQLIEMVRTNNSDNLWTAYAASIFTEPDRQNYQNLMQVRSNYLASCQNYWTLVSSAKMVEAADYYDGDLNRQFKHYNAAVKKVFDYNVRQGNLQGETILNATRLAPWAIAILSVLLFGFGLVLGMRFSLSGGKLKI